MQEKNCLPGPLRPVLEAVFDLGVVQIGKRSISMINEGRLGEDLSPSLGGYLKVTRAQLSLLLLYVKGEGNAVFTVSSSRIPGQRT